MGPPWPSWRWAERESAGPLSGIKARPLWEERGGRDEIIPNLPNAAFLAYSGMSGATAEGAWLGRRAAASGVPGWPSPGGSAAGTWRCGHASHARSSVPPAGRHQPGDRGCGSTGCFDVSSGADTSLRGKGGGRWWHNRGDCGGERGGLQTPGLTRWRGSAGLSTTAKPPRTRPLPAGWVSRAAPHCLRRSLESASQAMPLPLLTPRAAPSAHTSPVFIAGLFSTFYSPCFPYGETEAGGTALCPQASPGSHHWMQRWLVGEEEEEGLPGPPTSSSTHLCEADTAPMRCCSPHLTLSRAHSAGGDSTVRRDYHQPAGGSCWGRLPRAAPALAGESRHPLNLKNNLGETGPLPGPRGQLGPC